MGVQHAGSGSLLATSIPRRLKSSQPCKRKLHNLTNRDTKVHAHSWTTGDLPTLHAPYPTGTLQGASGNKRQVKVMLRNEMAGRLQGHEEAKEDARGPRDGPDDGYLDADQRQLTSKIKASKHARELHKHLVHAGPRVVNAIHVGLGFQKVAHLHRGGEGIIGTSQSQILFSLLERLSNHAFHTCPTMSPIEVARILWSSSTLDFPLDPRLVDRLMARLLTQRHKWNSVDVSNVAWSLPALLASYPKPYSSHLGTIKGYESARGRIEWLIPLVSSIVEGAEALPPRSLVVTSNSLSKASIVYRSMVEPGPARHGTSDPLLLPTQVRKLAGLLCFRSESYSPQDTVNALGTLSRLGVKPEERWMRAITSQATTRMRDFKGEEVVLMTYALAKLKYRPPLDLMNSIFSSSAMKLASCPNGMLSVLLWSVAQLTESVGGAPTRWVNAVLDEMCEREHCRPFESSEGEEGGVSGADERGEGGGRARDLAVAMYSLARLEQGNLGEGNLRFLLAQLGSILSGDQMGSRELAVVSWAAGCMSRTPPPTPRAMEGRPRESFLPRGEQRESFLPRGGPRVSFLPLLLQTQMAEAAVHDGRLRRFSQHNLSMFLWGAARSMQEAADGGRAPWVIQAGEEAYTRLQTLDSTVFPQLLWALGRLGYRADATWCGKAESRALFLLQRLSPEGLTSVIHSFSWLGHLPSVKFLTSFSEEVALKSATLDPEAHLGIARVLKRFTARHEGAMRAPKEAVQIKKPKGQGRQLSEAESSKGILSEAKSLSDAKTSNGTLSEAKSLSEAISSKGTSLSSFIEEDLNGPWNCQGQGQGQVIEEDLREVDALDPAAAHGATQSPHTPPLGSTSRTPNGPPLRRTSLTFPKGADQQQTHLIKLQESVHSLLGLRRSVIRDESGEDDQEEGGDDVAEDRMDLDWDAVMSPTFQFDLKLEP